MDSQTLTIKAPQLLLFVFNRGWSHSARILFVLVLFSPFFCLTSFGSSYINGRESSVYDVCRSYKNTQGADFHDIIGRGDDFDEHHISRTSMNDVNVESVCSSSNLFCFPSTLPGYLPMVREVKRDAFEGSRMEHADPLLDEARQASRWVSNETWLSDYGVFESSNGRTISCSMNSEKSIHMLSSIQRDSGYHNDISLCQKNLQNQQSADVRLNRNSDMNKQGCLDVVSSPNVEIRPPVLDWGQKYLFSPSVAFLTVGNTCSDSTLHVYEPFSTNSQFYPCNYSEILLGPGESASICFVFLPRSLGLSTSRLVLQTNSGGFLVSAKGFAIDSPYKIEPFTNLDVPAGGHLRKNFSLFNPFDETLVVEEVAAWISVIGNVTYHTEAVCGLGNYQNSKDFTLPSVHDWLTVKIEQAGFPLMAMRPYRNWEIGPRSSETVMEIDFSFGLRGKMFGAFCIQLMMPSLNKSDTVMIPLEVDLDRKTAYEDLTSLVSVSLESLVACDYCRTFVAISLRNSAPYMLKFVKITEVGDTKPFPIKYLEDLLLFPGTVTRVAVATCSLLPVKVNDCKLVILTNDSTSPQIEVPCQDIVHVCRRYSKDSSIRYERESHHVKFASTMKESFVGDVQSPSDIKALERAEADEFVLGNWKSQGAQNGLSVLEDQEILFPTIQVGTHRSKWITVRNPSPQPVMMQLILNTAEIIDECKGTDGLLQPPSAGSVVHSKSARPTRYGFSISDSGLTESYVPPYGRASFGPIFFHPSDRCSWRSSALIRNNLSGVEWLSLRGSGGSLSLVLLEGSELIETVEFNLNLLVRLNITPPDMKETTSICSQTLFKELYAKNTGDLPLEVKSIEVSGTQCRLDGFIVHTCAGFSLEPGESTKLLISYQTDFSAAMVHRDLELALASGILAIPMKASLPVCVMNLCKKSLFWMRLKKLSVAILFVASLLFLALSCLYVQMTAFGSHDFFYRIEKNSITAIRDAGKSSHAQHNQSKFSVPQEMRRLLTAGERKTFQPSLSEYSDGQNGVVEQDVSTQGKWPRKENHKNSNCSSDVLNGVQSSLPSKSAVIENSNAVEELKADNLTVRTGKEKGKRRRKRKGAGAVLSGHLEVSSSQSGNSTPSSPLSPVMSVVPNRAWLLSPEAGLPYESKNSFPRTTDQFPEKSRVPKSPPTVKGLESQAPVKCHSYSQHLYSPEQQSAPRPGASKPILLPSATFPSASRTAPSRLCTSPSLASISKIAPCARAPGSKLSNQKSANGDQAGVRDEYTYDIWGDHLSGLGLVGRSKDVSGLNLSAAENNSDSFFVRGPQTLVPNSQSRSVSCLNPDGK